MPRKHRSDAPNGAADEARQSRPGGSHGRWAPSLGTARPADRARTDGGGQARRSSGPLERLPEGPAGCPLGTPAGQRQLRGTDAPAFGGALPAEPDASGALPDADRPRLGEPPDRGGGDHT